MDSTYSRPVLAAKGNLGGTGSSVKAGAGALPEIAVLSARAPWRVQHSRGGAASYSPPPKGRCRIDKTRAVLVVLVTAVLVLLPAATASHTPAPLSVTVAGSLQSEAGCPDDLSLIHI